MTIQACHSSLDLAIHDLAVDADRAVNDPGAGAGDLCVLLARAGRLRAAVESPANGDLVRKLITVRRQIVEAMGCEQTAE